jgi:sortase A
LASDLADWPNHLVAGDLLEPRPVHSHTTVIIPFDDRVLFVRLLNCVELPRRLSEALVRLTIAKINLDAVIVEGTSRESLRLGPGHMEDSALPGYSGNSVIVAHRDTFFRHLDELQGGWDLPPATGRVYRFEVAGRRVVEPADLSALRQSPSAQLTLITCYPTHYVGPAPKRLVVVARLIATLKSSGE